MDGALIVDKPSGWTSHDVVNKVRRLADTKKVGHLGTLDPLATGVLPLVMGRATRLAQFFTRNDKVYEARIRFGWSTDSYDADGESTSSPVAVELDETELKRLLKSYEGESLQTPPPVSAKKVSGVPAYKLARKQQVVELKPAPVTIFECALKGIEGDEAAVRIHCSAGTYVRAIAHEIGQTLGCGAFLSALRRTASGDFAIGQACTLERLAELAAAGDLAQVLLPASKLLPEFPVEVVDALTAGRIRQGREFRASPFQARFSRYVKAVTPQGELVAIGEAKLPNVYHPVLVL
ncbi:MAG: tRNA pseudouridine(55) synthase TruB [Bryobacteraceae bacterium]|nr:tRNA pseudouridine(55) synthase TruB [Bryobacteraceae bacterium]